MSKLSAIKMFDIRPQQYIPNLISLFSKVVTAAIKKQEPETGNKEAKEMYDNLYQAKKEMHIAGKNFEFAQEQELIDYYSYQIKAAQIKYQYLLKKIREQNKNYRDFKSIHVMDEEDNYLRQ